MSGVKGVRAHASERLHLTVSEAEGGQSSRISEGGVTVSTATRGEGVRRFIRLLLRQNEVQVVRGLLDVPGMRASAPMIVQL